MIRGFLLQAITIPTISAHVNVACLLTVCSIMAGRIGIIATIAKRDGALAKTCSLVGETNQKKTGSGIESGL